MLSLQKEEVSKRNGFFFKYLLNIGWKMNCSWNLSEWLLKPLRGLVVLARATTFRVTLSLI